MEQEKSTARPRGTDSAKVIQVIITEALIGNGTESDPCRIITQYWSLDGEKLTEHDPFYLCETESASSKVNSAST